MRRYDADIHHFVLFKGSKAYYEALRGVNGRFRYLKIADIILPGAGDETIKEWDAASGICLKTLKKEDNPDLFEYRPTDKTNTKLKTSGNKIYIPGPPG